jgi:hypothetical protein
MGHGTATVTMEQGTAAVTIMVALLAFGLMGLIVIKLDRRRRLRQPNPARDWDGEKVDEEFRGVMQDLLQ